MPDERQPCNAAMGPAYFTDGGSGCSSAEAFCCGVGLCDQRPQEGEPAHPDRKSKAARVRAPQARREAENVLACMSGKDSGSPPLVRNF